MFDEDEFGAEASETRAMPCSVRAAGPSSTASNYLGRDIPTSGSSLGWTARQAVLKTRPRRDAGDFRTSGGKNNPIIGKIQSLAPFYFSLGR